MNKSKHPITFIVSTLVFLSMVQVQTLSAQLTSFHKLYKTEHFTVCFDIAPTPDQGYIITGFEDRPAPFNMPLVPYLSKIDCTGEIEWIRKYGLASNIGNVDPRVGVLGSGDYIMMSTVIGVDYDILVVKTSPDGEAIWRKTYGGLMEDTGRGMTIPSDDNILVVGSTQSYGSDVFTPYSDMYFLKIDSHTGDTLWTKTYGETGGIDDLWDVVELPDGSLTLTGRSFFDDGIWLSLIHTSADGDIEWVKLYGKTNHHTQGFDLERLPDGGYLITGMTTLAKQDFNSFMDAPVIRTDDSGNIIWATILHGSSPDLSEVASSLVVKNDTVAIALQSTSYPDPSPDITKRMLYMVDLDSGGLLQAKSFNGSGGQFPILRNDWHGFIMSGFTDEFDGYWNDPIILKLDEDFDSGCEETDWTSLTQEESPAWDVREFEYEISSGAIIGEYLADSLAANYQDSTFCFTGTIPNECEIISNTNQITLDDKLQVFPNPFEDVLNIAFISPPKAPYQLQFSTIDGKVIRSRTNLRDHSFTLEIANLPAGIYILQIWNDQQMFIKKVKRN